jgi:hypothetical protein
LAVVGRAVACAVAAGLDDDDLDAVLAVVAWFAFVRLEAVRV